MTPQQLQASFDYCKSHDDPQAWEALALAYLERGYILNPAYIRLTNKRLGMVQLADPILFGVTQC